MVDVAGCQSAEVKRANGSASWTAGAAAGAWRRHANAAGRAFRKPWWVAAPPALLRRPNQPIPLLPSGPGGVFSLSSRRHRRGHHWSS